MKGATWKNISQKGGLLYILGPWMKVGLPLMKNVLTQLVKNVLLLLRVIAAASPTDTTIQ